MKTLKWMLLLFVLPACSFIEKTRNDALLEENMFKAIQKEIYPYSLSELKQQIDQYYTLSSALGGKWVYTNHSAEDQRKLQQIDQIMNEGFFYKQKLYSSDIEISELFKDGQIDKTHFVKSKYHLLEDSQKEFLLAKGSTFFVAKSISKNKSTLQIYRFNAIIRNTSINWWNVLRRKNINSFFEKDPPSFEESRPYAVIDKAQTMSFFYKFNKDRASQLEKELSK